GDDRGRDAESVLAEPFAWTAEASRPQVVDAGDVAPAEGDEGQSEDGCRGRSLHHLLGISARA
ncbi:MAG: hypothetical protein ABJQ14_09635, partial [Hyphomicrobiales bacterium]